MRDDKGVYYFPFPQNRQVRMYVREAGGTVEFRLWNQGDPGLWDQHGWVPYEAILEASGIYTGTGFDPAKAYDLDIARSLLAEHRTT